MTPQSTGEVFGANQLYNFRSFYRSLLAISLEGYAESTTEDNLMLSLKFGHMTEQYMISSFIVTPPEDVIIQ